MNLYISPVNALIFALACLVICFVYRRTNNQQPTAGTTTSGNPIEALAAGGVALAMLAFLFGVGDGSFTSTEPSAPMPPAISPTPPSR